MIVSAQTVATGRLNKDIRLAQGSAAGSWSSDFTRNLAVESLNSGFSILEYDRFSATQLLGSVIGDTIGDTAAEVIGKKQKAQQSDKKHTSSYHHAHHYHHYTHTAHVSGTSQDQQHARHAAANKDDPTHPFRDKDHMMTPDANHHHNPIASLYDVY